LKLLNFDTFTHLSDILEDPSIDEIVNFAPSSDQFEAATALMTAANSRNNSELKPFITAVWLENKGTDLLVWTLSLLPFLLTVTVIC